MLLSSLYSVGKLLTRHRVINGFADTWRGEAIYLCKSERTNVCAFTFDYLIRNLGRRAYRRRRESHLTALVHDLVDVWRKFYIQRHKIQVCYYFVRTTYDDEDYDEYTRYILHVAKSINSHPILSHIPLFTSPHMQL